MMNVKRQLTNANRHYEDFNKNPSRENHMHTKLARAKARRTIKDAKRTSWRQYVNKLNSRTPIKKVWDMIRKSVERTRSLNVFILNRQMVTCVTQQRIFPMH